MERGIKDDGTWTWLLPDPHGNVATLLKADGTVAEQKSYDPYGANDPEGSTGNGSADPESELGFQSAITDPETGKVLVGPRQYDPERQNFTTSDFYVGADSDMALGTDPLTGNRYLFAAANPVSFYDDGHRLLCGDDTCSHEGSFGDGKTDPNPPVSRADPDPALRTTGLLPAERGYSTCMMRPVDFAEGYLSGSTCPPPGFPYDPVIRNTDAGPRALDPYNDGCSAVPESGSYFDFTQACLMHDYGYDLVRFGTPLVIRGSVDSAMTELMDANCDARGGMDGALCDFRTSQYTFGLSAWTIIQGSWTNGGVTGSIATRPGPNTNAP